MKYQKPRGTQDFLPDYIDKWDYVAGIWRDTVRRYNFREIVTPMFETTELFSRTAGDTSDIVTKEMYTFRDRGDRSLTLRPEGTSPVVRAYFENRLYVGLQPVKLFYLMPMFRYERPQAGRFRQHHQYGVECIGVRSPYVDVEVMSLAMEFYNRLGVLEPVIWLNSLGCEHCRPKYKQMLVDYLKDNQDQLCDECRIRLDKNPLRVLDCKNENCRRFIDSAPLMKDNLCPDCAKDFEMVKRLLSERGINYVVSPMLVRGLDYYNRTVFEVAAKGVSAKDVIAGGGRYDLLLKEIGGTDSSAFGFGAGMERLISTLENQGVTIPVPKRNRVAVISMDESTASPAFALTQSIRQTGIISEFVPLGKSKLGKLLENLQKSGYAFAVLIGMDELQSGQVAVKALDRRSQVNVAIDDIEGFHRLIENG